LFFLLFSLPALACGGGSTGPPTETPTLTETASVTPSLPAPTATSQPATIPPPTVEATPPTPAGATVSYNGISFNLNPALGDTAYVHDEQMYGSEVNYTRFTFAPEGWCREVGCVEVYPTTDYRAAFPDQPFPPLGAATLLRAQQQSLDFQNGSGARAIRMYGQAAYFANNESLVYTFAGFTADDQYYVFVEIPIDAPLLMSAADPATNTNPAAQLPQAGQDEAAYNREIEQQLNLLAPADFTPSLSALDALVASLRIEAPSADTPPAEIAAPFRQVVNLDIALPPGKIAGMHAALDGSVWVFTEHGFGRLQDERWIPEPLGSAQTPVGVDDAGRVWVLTDGLMYARDIATDESVAANDGWLPNPNPIGLAGRGVHTDAAGRVWLATWDDVRMFDGRRWTVYAPQDMGMAAPEDPDYFTPYALEVAHQSETLWVGRCDWGGPGPVGGGGARWWDSAAWQGADSPVAEGCVLAIQEDNQGRVWVGVDADLWRYDPVAGEWQRFAPPESSEGYRFGY
ncbi:MAG: two-component regulator propeller domain-containing protein, partial [Anaerolineales bacterium]